MIAAVDFRISAYGSRLQQQAHGVASPTLTTVHALSWCIMAVFRGVDAFVAPALTFPKLDTSDSQRACSSSRGPLGARPDLINVNVGTTGAKRGRGCHQQQQAVLKAEMTDEEMALDQVRRYLAV